jgi:hypothetical protein
MTVPQQTNPRPTDPRPTDPRQSWSVLKTACLLIALTANAEDLFTEKLYPIFEKAQCRLCHNDNGVASGTRLRFPGEKATPEEINQFGLNLRAFINPNRPEDSLLLRKPTNRLAHTGGERIRQGSEDEKVLQAWATHLSRLPAAVVSANKPRAKGREITRRLTHSQYNNTVRDLLGDESRPASKFPSEDFVHGFTNQAEGQGMSPILSEAYSQAAEKLARNAFRGGDANHLISCKPASPTDEACRERFVNEFGLRAFRRPLRSDESARYGKLFAMEAGRAKDFLKGAQVVVEAMLQSPNFLFHVEPGADPAQRQYAVANRLSYFLWDTMPDQALLETAGAGQLSTNEQIRKQVERLLSDPRAKTAMEEFLAQWLRYDRLRTAFRDVRLYPEFSSELVSSMFEETRLLFDHLVWDDRNFLEFFTADYAFLSAGLARLYGLPEPAEPFSKVAFPADSPRGGVLGQATFLSVTGKPADSSPTERGLFIREHFLCHIVPPPPPGVNTTLPPLTDEKPLNNRQRLQVHLGNPTCSGCHRLIDPIGFGFENFDAIGRFREKQVIRIYPTFDEMKNKTKTRPTEHKLDIDVSGFIQGMPNSQFKSPKEAGRVLASDPGCQKCVVKMLFRYAVGRPETEADQAPIESALREFRSSQFRFKNLIIAIATSEPFLGGPY